MGAKGGLQQNGVLGSQEEQPHCYRAQSNGRSWFLQGGELRGIRWIHAKELGCQLPGWNRLGGVSCQVLAEETGDVWGEGNVGDKRMVAEEMGDVCVEGIGGCRVRNGGRGWKSGAASWGGLGLEWGELLGGVWGGHGLNWGGSGGGMNMRGGNYGEGIRGKDWGGIS